MLKLLLRAGIVEHVARADWRIVDPLFQAYLRDLDPYLGLTDRSLRTSRRKH